MRRILQGLLIILALFSVGFLATQPAAAQEDGVVHAVLFYSPTCPHCHEVINNVLPPLLQEYGDALQIIGINTTTIEGQELYQAAIDNFQISEERQGVPTLIVGETILVGSGEIPEQFPGIIEQGLAEGGIAWPAIPGLEDSIARGAAQATAQTSQAGNTSAATSSSAPEQNQTSGWVEKFQRDVVGNSAAVLVLLAMIVSVILVWIRISRPLEAIPAWIQWAVPALSVVGLLVAGYMTYAEVSHAEVVCGPVGDCNTVQQSPYAMLYGVLPVGVLGLIGYAAILSAWALQYYGPQAWRTVASYAVWGFALFGTVFSIYLTFLEPFVIGATCIWCLSSAIIMMLMLWASGEPLRLLMDNEIDLDDFEEDAAEVQDPIIE
ncbi:MAG: vitamin K epoxide reductase [Chloroflexi bacterium]|jgi:uncharacterized membrane protein|nr:vitamin K epoxide reductase [Chloroflexota bacterium]